MSIRPARCGHFVPSHPGRQRLACDHCAPSRKPRKRTELPLSVYITCSGCTERVAVRQPRSGPLARYCSRSCAQRMYDQAKREDGRWEAQLAAKRAKRVPASYQVTCSTCGCEFTVRHRNKRYCSNACARKAALPCSEAGCSRPSVVARPVRLCSSHYNQRNYSPEQRRQSRLRQAVCEHCGKTYMAQRTDQRYCSLLCRSGGEFKNSYTEAERRAFREARRKRRALLRQIECEDFDEREIYERDKWQCQICRKRVSKKLQWPHPRSASLDHIIPVTKPGSSHTKRNVRLAHLVCNTSRGNRGGGEQLLLVG